MLKAVIFDLDQTLIDFLRMKKLASDAAASAMVKAGLKMPVKTARKRLFEIYLKIGIESNKVFSKFLKENSMYSDRIVAAAINAYLKSKYSNIKPYSKVPFVLKILKRKGFKLGIATDAPRIKAYQRLDAMKIADLFDAIVGFEDTGKKKPSILPFKVVLKKLKLKSSEVIMVGDNPKRDIMGAKRLGIKTCFAKYGNPKVKNSGADFEIKRFEDLLRLVK